MSLSLDSRSVAPGRIRLLRPVLSEVPPEILLSPPGAPPRLSAIVCAPKPEVCPPKLEATKRPVTFDTSSQEVNYESILPSICTMSADERWWSQHTEVPEFWKDSRMLRSVPSTEADAFEWRSTAGAEAILPGVGSHAYAVSENLQTRGTLPKGCVMNRSQMDASLAHRDLEMSKFAKFRREQHQLAKEFCRESAAKWREKRERELRLQELQWNIKHGKDAQLKSMIYSGRSKHVTPVKEDEIAEERRASMNQAEPRSARLLKDLNLKLHSPVEVRLKFLRKLTKQRYSVNAKEKDEVEFSLDRAKVSEGAGRRIQLSLERARDSIVVRRDSANQSRDPSKEQRPLWNPWPLTTVATTEEVERSLLQVAFGNLGVNDDEPVDANEVQDCMTFMGLRPRTREERRAIKAIIESFEMSMFDAKIICESVIPQVREKLMELRRPDLLAFFTDVEHEKPGCMTEEDMLAALRRLADPEYDIIRDAAMHHFTMSSLFDEEDVGAEDFLEFAQVYQEFIEQARNYLQAKIVKQYSVSAEEEDWKLYLVEWHSMFHVHDPRAGKYGSPIGVVNKDQMASILRETGYLALVEEGPESSPEATLSHVLRSYVRADKTYGFAEFLRIMRFLLEQDKRRIEPSVKFQMLSKNLSSVPESMVFDIIAHLGNIPRTATEKLMIKWLVEEALLAGMENDDVEDGHLSPKDVVILCQCVFNRLQAMQHERERQYALSTRWSEKQFSNVRNAFYDFDEDLSGVLERDELMKAVEVLKGQYSPSEGSVDLMFLALGINPQEEVQITFLVFLQMLKMMEDSVIRREQGQQLGFDDTMTDRLYTAFQALYAGDIATAISRKIFQRVMAEVANKMSEDIDEVMRELDTLPSQIDFFGYLTIMQALEVQLEEPHLFEDFVNRCIVWGVDVGSESESTMTESPSCSDQRPSRTI